MKACTYTRVSTEEQVENGTSLETQREQATAYITSRGWTLVAEYEDAGISGTKDESGRPGLRAMMDAARGGDVEVVVVTKLDRFGRSNRLIANALGDLDDLGVAFVSLSEQFDTSTPMGKGMLAISGVFAEIEHATIRERMMAGKAAIRAQGYWTGGPVPYGFRAVAVENTKHKRLVVDEAEAAVVRLAASLLVDQAQTPPQVADHLNALDHRPRRAKRWNLALIRHTLKRKSLVPEVLDQERFDAVQEALQRTSTVRRDADQVYPLSMRLFGRCGEAYRGTYRKDLGHRFYMCGGKWTGERCDDHSIRADDIDYVVWEEVCDLLSKPERLLALAEEYLGLRGRQVEVERDEYDETQKKVADLDKAIQNLLVTSAKRGLAPQDIERAADDLTRERDALRKRLAMIESWRAESEKESNRMRRLWELSEAAHKRLPGMTAHEQKQVLDLLDVQVTVIEQAHKTKGGRVVAPARIRIEGQVSDQVVFSADASPREMTRKDAPRS